LIWPGYFCGSLCCCNGEFITGSPEIRTARRCGDLLHDVAEHLVARRERDLALDLDLDNGRRTTRVMSMDDDVIERPPLACALKLNSIDHHPG